MSKEQLKKELHQLIDHIDDEELLGVVKEDIVAYQKAATGFDDLSDLSETDRADLEESIKQNSETDNVSEEGFNIFINEWRKKLSIKSDL